MGKRLCAAVLQKPGGTLRAGRSPQNRRAAACLPGPARPLAWPKAARTCILPRGAQRVIFISCQTSAAPDAPHVARPDEEQAEQPHEKSDKQLTEQAGEQAAAPRAARESQSRATAHDGKHNAPSGANGANMSEKAPESYQLVLINGKKEEVLFSSPVLLDVQLKREQHIRSITTGHVEIRTV